jgi:hypothetical protein
MAQATEATLQDERLLSEAPRDISQTTVDGLIDPVVKMPVYKPSFQNGIRIQTGDKQVAEATEEKALNPMTPTVGDTFERSWRSGGNIGYQVYKHMDRAIANGPIDPEWRGGRGEEWVKKNKIHPDQQWRYTSARNQEEAQSMLWDAQAQAEDQRILALKHGVSNTVAEFLPGLIDVDTPLALFTGGVGEKALAGIAKSRAGRIVAGSVGGLASGTALGAVDYAVDPNSDWTVIPTIGLMSMGFGAAAGSIGHGGAHAGETARKATLNEFGETLADGAPRSKENMFKDAFEHTDPYMSEAADRDIAEFNELVKGANADLGDFDQMMVAANGDINKFKQAMAAAEQAHAAKKTEGTAAPKSTTRAPEAIDPSEIDIDGKVDVELPDGAMQLDPDKGKGSIGARQLNTQGPGVASIRSAKIQDTINNARSWARQSGISTQWLDGWSNLQGKWGAVGAQAERFHNAYSHSPLATDFAQLMNSGSAVAQKLAYDVYENAAGIVRNGRSAARIMEHYHKELMSKFAPFHDAYSEWAQAQGAGFWERNWDAGIRERFNREVMSELMARRYDGTAHTPRTDAVGKAANSVDNTYAHELKVVQGRPGESAVFGTETIVPTKGYVQQKWLGRNIRSLIDSGRFTRDHIKGAISENYRQLYPNMARKDADIYADAVVGRAEKYDTGINTNLIGVLQGDGRTELADVLRRQGMNEHEIDRFIERLTGIVAERGKAGHFKHRLDIDARYTSTQGVQLMDLIDTDFATMMPSRMRRSAGQSALARKGIRSKQDWNDITAAILEEQAANGQSQMLGQTLRERVSDAVNADKHVSDKFLDEIYTYFSGAPVAGGISPLYSRMKKITNLALLNQLGVTQIAELGINIASVGVDSWFKHAGEAFQGLVKGAESPLAQELKHLDIMVPEERLFRDDLTHEFEKVTTQNEYKRNFDRLLNKGQRLQGYTSGFYWMRNFQQRIAVTSAADRLAKHFRDGGKISPERLYDMGFTDAGDISRIHDYVQNGIVDFDANGNLVRLNLDQWMPQDADVFTYSLNAQVNTLVQKAMAGESSTMFHRDGVASMFFHLKSFPMLALEKQVLRQTRFMDQELAMQFMYGLGTAATAYTVRQAINGRTDKLDPVDIAKGAFGYSNLTGWIPMWTDPLAGMLGMDSLKVGGYAGMGLDVLSQPAVLPTLDRMAQLPGAAIDLATFSPDSGTVNALTATPIIGNAYGFNLMFNTLRNYLKESKAAEKKAEAATAREEKAAEEKAAKDKAKKEKQQAKHKEDDVVQQALKAAGDPGDVGGIFGLLN